MKNLFFAGLLALTRRARRL